MITAAEIREKARARDSFLGRINNRLETERLNANDFITEDISYRKNKSGDLERFYENAKASLKKNVDDVYGEDDLRKMFADGEVLKAEQSLIERGFIVKYRGYCHPTGLIGCDLDISW